MRCNEISYLSSRGPLPLLIYYEGIELQVKYSILVQYLIVALRCTPTSVVRRRLHLVDRTTSDSAAHIEP